MVMEYAVEEDAKVYRGQPNQKKKIGFIKRWMLKAVKEAVASERQVEESDRYANIAVPKGLQIGREPPSIDSADRAIQFTVYTATGGRIVETRRYDRKTDRSTNGLYIVTSEQDFGREIDKIITMEALKQ